jgi:hypothetical protein
VRKPRFKRIAPEHAFETNVLEQASDAPLQRFGVNDNVRSSGMRPTSILPAAFRELSLGPHVDDCATILLSRL